MTAEAGRPIRVLLVDDHAVVRKGLCALFEREPGIDVAGEAESGEQAVAMAERLRPDVILMDLEMPGISVAEATRRIQRYESCQGCKFGRGPRRRACGHVRQRAALSTWPRASLGQPAARATGGAPSFVTLASDSALK